MSVQIGLTRTPQIFTRVSEKTLFWAFDAKRLVYTRIVDEETKSNGEYIIYRRPEEIRQGPEDIQAGC